MYQTTQTNPAFPYKQRGVGFAGWLIIIFFVGGALSVGTKLFPIYVDNNTLEGLLDKMSEESNMSLKSKSEIYKVLENRLKLNNVRDFPIQDNLDVVRTKDGTSLVLDYEQRVPVGGNIDLLVSFKKEVELRD